MRTRFRFGAVALAAALAAPAASADPVGSYFHVTPVAGGTIFNPQARFPGVNPVGDALYLGARVGFQFNQLLGLEVAGGLTPAKEAVPRGKDIDVVHLAGDLVLTPWANRFGGPMLFAGAGSSRLEPSWDLDGDEVTATTIEYGAGVRLWMTDGIGLRLEARNIVSGNEDALKGVRISNIVMGGGVTVAIGARARDTDADGVPDRKDECGDTPRGAVVDAIGCPIDSDGDAVYDGIDQCPGTPVGAVVDDKGCPSDPDGDGVFVGIDDCPDTPAGATVDAKGCPSDSDGDGVLDGIDQCSGTPQGAIVDAKGCPLDGDGDGVADGLDQCPETRSGIQVDEIGCPMGYQERERELIGSGRVLFGEPSFAPGKAELLPEALPRLDAIGDLLRKWPDLKVEIAGHTDSRGSEAANLALSKARAQALRDYLVERFPGIAPERFTVTGYGGSRPLVPNDSDANRAMNRRVEFRVQNLDVLLQELERRKPPGE